VSPSDSNRPWALGESLRALATRLNFLDPISQASDGAISWLGSLVPEALRDFPTQEDLELAQGEPQFAKDLNNFRGKADQAVRQFILSSLPQAKFEIGESKTIEGKHRHEHEEAIERLERLAFEVSSFRRVLSAVGKAEEAAEEAGASAERALDAVQLASRDHLRQDINAAARVLMGLSAALTALGAATLSGRTVFPDGYMQSLIWVLVLSGIVVASGLAIAVANARRSARAAQHARQASDVEVPGMGTWAILVFQLVFVVFQGIALLALLRLLISAT
jgi:hypothetical protein